MAVGFEVTGQRYCSLLGILGEVSSFPSGRDIEGPSIFPASTAESTGRYLIQDTSD